MGQGASSVAGAGADGAFTSTILAHHNIHRANHSAGPLVWDDGLAQAAQQLTDHCVWGHAGQSTYPAPGLGPNDGYGQNLAGNSQLDVAGAVSDQWYNGEFMPYQNSQDSHGGGPMWLSEVSSTDPQFENWGHLTQLVWQPTQKVGCGLTDCRNKGMGMWYMACNYHPAGNVESHFTENVKGPLGHPLVTGGTQL